MIKYIYLYVALRTIVHNNIAVSSCGCTDAQRLLLLSAERENSPHTDCVSQRVVISKLIF